MIKLACIDVDGCLTDGIYQISTDDVITKSFYTRDFWAIEELLKSNVKVAIVTQSHDEVIETQIERICSHSDIWKTFYENDYLSIYHSNDKYETVDDLKEDFNITWENIAYMGDAENDFSVMKKCKLIMCPRDAIDLIKETITVSEQFGRTWFISDYKGGKGAVRDFAEEILLYNKEKGYKR